MNYFAGCRTLAELKQRRSLYAKALHPDRGGDPEQFKAMERQYEQAQQTLAQRQNRVNAHAPHQPPQQPVVIIQQVVQQGQSQGMQMLERLLMKGAEVLIREGIDAITNNNLED